MLVERLVFRGDEIAVVRCVAAPLLVRKEAGGFFAAENREAAVIAEIGQRELIKAQAGDAACFEFVEELFVVDIESIGHDAGIVVVHGDLGTALRVLVVPAKKGPAKGVDGGDEDENPAELEARGEEGIQVESFQKQKMRISFRRVFGRIRIHCVVILQLRQTPECAVRQQLCFYK